MKIPKNWSSLTGLENLKKMLKEHSYNPDAMGETLNLKMLEVREGVCIYQGTPDKRHVSPRGFVHGGWVMSILDSAAVLAVVSALPKGKLCATATLEVKFARPIKADQVCRAEGELQYISKNLAHAKAKLTDTETGKLLAFCTCSTLIYDIND